MTRKRKPKGPLDGKKAAVFVERMGLTIRVDDVGAEQAGIVAADMLKTLRALVRAFPELREVPDVVPGGSPVEVADEDEEDVLPEERRRRIGF